jgi:hypothetical protein
LDEAGHRRNVTMELTDPGHGPTRSGLLTSPVRPISTLCLAEAAKVESAATAATAAAATAAAAASATAATAAPATAATTAPATAATAAPPTAATAAPATAANPMAPDSVARRNALMRFTRTGDKHLTGEALEAFNKQRSKARKQLFEVYLSSGESWDAVNVWMQQEMENKQADTAKTAREWKTRDWMMTNKYNGDAAATDNAILHLSRLPGHSREDPDGSGVMEYFVLVEDRNERASVSSNKTALTATATLSQSALRTVMQDSNPLFGTAVGQLRGEIQPPSQVGQATHA